MVHRGNGEREFTGWSRELKHKFNGNSTQAELSDRINFNVLDSKLYEYLKNIYIKDIKEAIQHIDSYGRVIGAEGKPLTVGDDSPYVKGLLIFSNGPNLDSYIPNMITRKNEQIQGPIKLKEFNTIDDFVHVKNNTLSNDVTLFYNDKTGDIKWVFSPVINYYNDVDEMSLIKSLPDNYLINMKKNTLGKRASVALVNSAKYPINAVVLKQSGGSGLGLLTHSAGGMVIQTGYAKPRSTDHGLVVDYIENNYIPYKDGVVLDNETKTPIYMINSAKKNHEKKEHLSESFIPADLPFYKNYPSRVYRFLKSSQFI